MTRYIFTGAQLLEYDEEFDLTAQERHGHSLEARPTFLRNEHGQSVSLHLCEKNHEFHWVVEGECNDGE